MLQKPHSFVRPVLDRSVSSIGRYRWRRLAAWKNLLYANSSGGVRLTPSKTANNSYSGSRCGSLVPALAAEHGQIEEGVDPWIRSGSLPLCGFFWRSLPF